MVNEIVDSNRKDLKFGAFQCIIRVSVLQYKRYYIISISKHDELLLRAIPRLREEHSDVAIHNAIQAYNIRILVLKP